MRLFSKQSGCGVLMAVAAGALALTAPPAAPGASQADAASKTAVRTTAMPPHLMEIRRELSGMLVALDPATGEFRMPSADERAALAGPNRAAARLAAPQPVDLPGGGSVLLSTAANMDLTTAVQGPDGTVTFRCTHGFDVASPAYAEQHRRLSTEVRHDR